MNLDIKRQRLILYGQTFHKWTPEKRIETLVGTAIEFSLAIQHLKINQNNDTYTKLVSSVADIETMLEACAIDFPVKFRESVLKVKKKRLVTLKNKTLENNKKVSEKSELEKQIIEPKKNWFRQFLDFF